MTAPGQPAPAASAGLRAVPGRGHVTLDWEPVPGRYSCRDGTRACC